MIRNTWQNCGGLNLFALTDEQSRLAAEHTRLAYHWVNTPRGRWLVDNVGEDNAISEAMLCLCKAARHYHPSKGAFSTLYTLIANQNATRCVDKSARRIKATALVGDIPAASTIADGDELKMLAILPSSQRVVVELWARGERVKNIAERLGISSALASSRLQDGLRRLRQAVA